MRALALLLLVLTACDRGPEVPTATENRDLDEASRMLNEADRNLSAVDGNGVRPAAGSGPRT